MKLAGKRTQRYFDRADKIENIVTALDNMKLYKFEWGVHVTVVGTSLETMSTQRIVSNVDAIEFRMQLWTFDEL
jgi:hypothetical protein